MPLIVQIKSEKPYLNIIRITTVAAISKSIIIFNAAFRPAESV